MEAQLFVEKLPSVRQVLPKPRVALFRNLEILKGNLLISKLRIFFRNEEKGYKEYERKNYKIFRKAEKVLEFKINSNVKLFKINLQFDSYS